MRNFLMRVEKTAKAFASWVFIRLMNERGYGVDWQDSHKYITYTDLAREQAGELLPLALPYIQYEIV